MKKKILVITYDKAAALYHAREVQALLGLKGTVIGCSVQDILEAPLPQADLYCITTDAVEKIPDFQAQFPSSDQIVYFFVAFSYEAIQKLREVPDGTKALFVNLNEKMALECITSLSQLGINQILFSPYYPGAALDGTDQFPLAVTPDEERYIPDGIQQVINVGQRKMDCNTLVEILLKLKFYDLLESPKIQNYLSSIASDFYSFNELLGRSTYMESTFQKLLDVLDTGIIGIDDRKDVFIYNRKAEQILNTSLADATGKSAESAVPYIPFGEYESSGYTIGNRLIRVHGIPINVDVVPLNRNNKQIGTIAILRHFAEEEARQNKIRIQLLEKGHKAKYIFNDIVGESPAIRKVKDIAQKMARTKSSILITGESGTGKELFAHAIHNASDRRDRPFIAINCAALPESLLESELFGYVDGAFTGAKKGGKMGLFEFAHTGTFFLDEVEGMSPALQVKLLRVLQEREIMRVGGTSIIPIDVRIVAATNESLERKVAEGTFRRDLYYRLSTLPIVIPPLSERGDDLFLILEQFQKELGGSFRLTPQVRGFLKSYSWPGNIRELRNVVEYFLYTGHDPITMEDLPPTVFHRAPQAPIRQLPETPQQPSSDVFRFVLEQLYQASEARQPIGRERLLQLARDAFVPTSQQEIRSILAQMADQGLVRVSRGRGGSQLTPEGRQLYETGRI